MYNRLSSRSRRLLLSVVVLLVAISSASAARPPKCPTAHSTNVEICEYVLDQARQFKDSNEQAEYVADVAGLYQRWDHARAEELANEAAAKVKPSAAPQPKGSKDLPKEVMQGLSEALAGLATEQITLSLLEVDPKLAVRVGDRFIGDPGLRDLLRVWPPWSRRTQRGRSKFGRRYKTLMLGPS